jgi:hypothetical protein
MKVGNKLFKPPDWSYSRAKSHGQTTEYLAGLNKWHEKAVLPPRNVTTV